MEALAAQFVYVQAWNPPGIVVYDNRDNWVATFTDGCRTVSLVGPQRKFTERGSLCRVEHGVYVRVLDSPFAGQVDEDWLAAALSGLAEPDVLEFASQYTRDAPPTFGPNFTRIAGDAGYAFGADFNDYMAVPWIDPEGRTHMPRPGGALFLDCSGYIRMVWGYRAGLPLSWDYALGAIPRTAADQALHGPGVLLGATDAVQPGDLLYFDTGGDGTINHAGMYLGMDDAGHHRFISSRQSAQGPTMGDVGALSIIDGDGFYARALRFIRRF